MNMIMPNNGESYEILYDYETMDTGGGCTALIRHYKGTVHILTCIDGIHIPEHNERVLLGVYASLYDWDDGIPQIAEAEYNNMREYEDYNEDPVSRR